MGKEREVRVNPNIDFSKMNVGRFYATLARLIEEQTGVKITYELREKTPEEMAKDPHKTAEVSESVRLQLQKWKSEL